MRSSEPKSPSVSASSLSSSLSETTCRSKAEGKMSKRLGFNKCAVRTSNLQKLSKFQIFSLAFTCNASLLMITVCWRFQHRFGQISGDRWAQNTRRRPRCRDELRKEFPGKRGTTSFPQTINSLWTVQCRLIFELLQVPMGTKKHPRVIRKQKEEAGDAAHALKERRGNSKHGRERYERRRVI